MRYKGDWEHAQTVFAAWWCKDLDVPVVQVQGPKPGAEQRAGFDLWGFLRHKAEPERVIEEFERYCANTYFGGEAFPNLWVNLGPGVLAAYFTGYLEFDADSATAWFEKPMSWDEINRLEFTDRGHWWTYTGEITRRAAEAGKDKFVVGATDIGGNLDVLASFRGPQNLCLDLLHEPDLVRNTLDRTDAAWQQVYTYLYEAVSQTQRGTSAWMGLWCPGRWYPLQCDFSAMISPAMFEQFVAPSLQRQCQFLDASIYHLDGSGQLPHLDILLEIPELDGIQWVPGAGVPQCEAPQWLPIYEKILAKNKLLVLQCFDDLAKVPALLEQIPNTGVLISAPLGTQQDAQDFLRAVRGPNL